MEVYPLTVLLQVLLNSLNRHFRYGFEMNERANCMQFTKQYFKVHSYDYLPVNYSVISFCLKRASRKKKNTVDGKIKFLRCFPPFLLCESR